jgi:ribose/xylose/arabinose/galactoside ABC-type transport system permease subunit
MTKLKLSTVKRTISENGAFIALCVMLLAASLIYREFFTYSNLSNVLRQTSMVGLVSIGMTLVILTAGIDLSVGATVALSAIIAAKLSIYGLFPAMLVSLLAGIISVCL